MKTMKATLGALLLAATLFGAQQASATPITYRDADQISLALSANGANGPSTYNGNFNFMTPDGTSAMYAVNFGGADGIYKSQLGFNPQTQSVRAGSGKIYLFLRDPRGGKETGTVTVLNMEALDTINSFQTYTILSDAFSVNVAAKINADGQFDYSITATSGDFYLRGAYAQFSVPDGGTTAALLGCSLLGLVYLRRRLAPVQA